MGSLGFNLASLVGQIVAFLALFAVLYLLLYKPVLRMLDARANRIKESLGAAERAREEAAQSQQQMQQQLEQARAEGQQLIAQAREVADRFRQEEIVKAREEIAAERSRAQANIQRESDAAIEEVRREFAGLAIAAAERVIDRSLDESTHRDLIEGVLEEGPRPSRN